MMLAAYAGIHFDRLDPTRTPALLMNLIGSVLVLVSMFAAFNLAACLMETAWGLFALFGLVRRLTSRR